METALQIRTAEQIDKDIDTAIAWHKNELQKLEAIRGIRTTQLEIPLKKQRKVGKESFIDRADQLHIDCDRPIRGQEFTDTYNGRYKTSFTRAGFASRIAPLVKSGKIVAYKYENTKVSEYRYWWVRSEWIINGVLGRKYYDYIENEVKRLQYGGA